MLPLPIFYTQFPHPFLLQTGVPEPGTPSGPHMLSFSRAPLGDDLIDLAHPCSSLPEESLRETTMGRAFETEIFFIVAQASP